MLTAGFNFLPLQEPQCSSVIYEAKRDRVRSEFVSVYVRRILAKTPSQGLVILYADPFSELNSKLMAVLPEPYKSTSFASSSNSPNGTSVGYP